MQIQFAKWKILLNRRASHMGTDTNHMKPRQENAVQLTTGQCFPGVQGWGWEEIAELLERISMVMKLFYIIF